jgi:hypothetical protein
MKLPSTDSDDNGGYEIPRLFGPPLVLVRESCAGFAVTHLAAFASSLLDTLCLCHRHTFERIILENPTTQMNQRAPLDLRLQCARSFCPYLPTIGKGP